MVWQPVAVLPSAMLADHVPIVVGLRIAALAAGTDLVLDDEFPLPLSVHHHLLCSGPVRKLQGQLKSFASSVR